MNEDERGRFFDGLSFAAYERGIAMQDPKLLEDGWVEVVFIDEDGGDDPDCRFESSVDFREVGEFNGSKMLEVRAWDFKEEKWHKYFISAIPYILFGAVYCET